jgi:glycosyltransferase involved in cell wall biosynthesis
MKIIICTNSAWNLLNFRSELIKALVARGHEVVAAAPYDKYATRLEVLGCKFLELKMDNGGTSPARDALLLLRYWRLLRREQPVVFLGFTVKPNVYGSLAAHKLGIPVINNIAGLGPVFIRGGWLAELVRGLYRVALGRSAKVFFQNPDDRQLFLDGRLVQTKVTEVLPGSGIDLHRFSVAPMPIANSKFRFLLIARMLRDKGVGEFVQAAKVLRDRWPSVEFCLLGFVNVQNPAAISRAEVESWVAQGFVNYLGVSDDVRNEIAIADCVVLPSYREGTPRSLLEAAAMGRPIITTDAVGCREVVDHGVNGYLCKVRDAEDLAEKMNQMLLLSLKDRIAMGLRGRAKMEAEFDEQIVIGKYLAAIEAI